MILRSSADNSRRTAFCCTAGGGRKLAVRCICFVVEYVAAKSKALLAELALMGFLVLDKDLDGLAEFAAQSFVRN